MESRWIQCFEVLEKIRIFVVYHKRSDMKYTFLRYAIGPISLLSLTLITACNRQREAKETWEPEMGVVDSGVIPTQPAPNILSTPDSEVPPSSSEATVPPSLLPEDHSPAEEKAQPSSIPSAVKKVTLSREYQEGYDNGYDDGEDDAVGDNGYGGQYDDACRYKGKKRRDYEEGYEDGYEAGYYDNNDLDD